MLPSQGAGVNTNRTETLGLTFLLHRSSLSRLSLSLFTPVLSFTSLALSISPLFLASIVLYLSISSVSSLAFLSCLYRSVVSPLSSPSLPIPAGCLRWVSLEAEPPIDPLCIVFSHDFSESTGEEKREITASTHSHI